MKNARNAKMLTLAAAITCLGCTALGQTTITQWNFDGAGLNVDGPAPSTGVGTAARLGGTVAPTSGAFPAGNGSAAAWSSSGYPTQSTANATAGFEFAVSTTNFQDIIFSFDGRPSNGASRWYEILYSTDGTNFVSAATPAVYSIAGASFRSNMTLDLTGIAAANNNPNFKVRVVSVYSPIDFVANSVNFTANTAYQPSGTALTATYNPGATTTAGTFRIDNVTFSGTATVSTPPSGIGRVQPLAVCPGGSTLLTVATTGGLNPASTGITVTSNLSAAGGPSSASFVDDGSNGDLAPGDGIYSYTLTVPGTTVPGNYAFVATVADAELRTSNTQPRNIAVGDCTQVSDARVVLAQVYGGGGGGSSDTINDYVVLHNRAECSVDVTGWSVQYASATGIGGFFAKVDLTGTIPAGGFYLVQMSTNGTIGNPLPTPDAIATGTQGVLMSATAGRIALVNDGILIGTNYTSPTIIDSVGYGELASTFEGAGPTADSSASLALFRKNNSCQDSNQNFNDFELGFPAPINSTATPIACGITCNTDPCNRSATCVADTDDGSSTGTPDGGVGIEDLLYYLSLYDSGTTCADVDDGSSTGTLDGGVGIEDLLYYLTRYDAGC